MEDIDYVKFNKYDLKILKLIALFGKTFDVVLGKTFFSSVQIARNNLSKMKKKGLIKFLDSGHLSPRKAIVLGYWGRKVLKDLDIRVQRYKKTRTLQHNILEQITFYHLSKIGRVEKKSVYHHKNTFYAVPDFVFFVGHRRIFVEVETTQKSKRRYRDFVRSVTKDKPDIVLYIAAKESFLRTLEKALPTWSKLLFIDIDTMIQNIENTKKVGAYKQKYLRAMNLEPGKKYEVLYKEPTQELKNALKAKISPKRDFSVETDQKSNKNDLKAISDAVEAKSEPIGRDEVGTLKLEAERTETFGSASIFRKFYTGKAEIKEKGLFKKSKTVIFKASDLESLYQDLKTHDTKRTNQFKKSMELFRKVEKPLQEFYKTLRE